MAIGASWGEVADSGVCAVERRTFAVQPQIAPQQFTLTALDRGGHVIALMDQARADVAAMPARRQSTALFTPTATADVFAIAIGAVVAADLANDGRAHLRDPSGLRPARR